MNFTINCGVIFGQQIKSPWEAIKNLFIFTEIFKIIYLFLDYLRSLRFPRLFTICCNFARVLRVSRQTRDFYCFFHKRFGTQNHFRVLLFALWSINLNVCFIALSGDQMMVQGLWEFLGEVVVINLNKD